MGSARAPYERPTEAVALNGGAILRNLVTPHHAPALAAAACERSPGDAQLRLGVEFTPKRIPGTAAGKQLRVGFQKAGAFGGVVF